MEQRMAFWLDRNRLNFSLFFLRPVDQHLWAKNIPDLSKLAVSQGLANLSATLKTISVSADNDVKCTRKSDQNQTNSWRANVCRLRKLIGMHQVGFREDWLKRGNVRFLFTDCVTGTKFAFSKCQFKDLDRLYPNILYRGKIRLRYQEHFWMNFLRS